MTKEELLEIINNSDDVEKIINLNICHCCKCGKLELKNGNGNGSHASQPEYGPLIVQAIVCTYSNGEITIQELAQIGIYFSSGLCKICAREALRKTIKKKQIREGNFPCFATADQGFCSQTECKYYSVCVIDHQEIKSHQEWLNKNHSFTTAASATPPP